MLDAKTALIRPQKSITGLAVPFGRLRLTRSWYSVYGIQNIMKHTPSMSTAFNILGLEPISSTTLSEQIADQIVDAIVSGRILPGQRLVEAALAAELQVSRIPVREAMQTLHRQGLLSSASGRGLRVSIFDSRWARQLCDVRLCLERSCVEQVVGKLRASSACLSQLDAVLDDMRRQSRVGDLQVLNRLDIAFHSVLYDLADSPLLSALWSGISRHALILFSLERDRSDYKRIVEEHESYRAALLSGDDTKIRIEIENHIQAFQILSLKEDPERKRKRRTGGTGSGR
jgi:DNA-binding GntR family transcriptional regulator